MSRRVSLPGADELFRVTEGAGHAEQVATGEPAEADREDEGEARPPGRKRSSARLRGERRPSGRERHDEKITVYCSPEELYDLEHARLVLRGQHGLAIDRGRIVREALAVILADLDAKGDDSILVRRLRGQ